MSYTDFNLRTPNGCRDCESIKRTKCIHTDGHESPVYLCGNEYLTDYMRMWVKPNFCQKRINK